MKRLIWIVSVLLLLLATNYSFAAEDKQKGASETAYEHASERSVFNRFGDWFATVGKSEEEKARIMEERKAGRSAGKAEKRGKPSEEMERKKTEFSKKEMKKTGEMNKNAEKEAEKAQKEAEKAKEKSEKKKGEATQKTERHKKELEDVEDKPSSGKWGSKAQKKGAGKGKGRNK